MTNPPTTGSYFRDTQKFVLPSSGTARLIDILQKRDSKNMTPTKSILADKRTYDPEILAAQQINSSLPKNVDKKKSRTIRIT